jgi:hypothetical protein
VNGDGPHSGIERQISDAKRTMRSSQKNVENPLAPFAQGLSRLTLECDGDQNERRYVTDDMGEGQLMIRGLQLIQHGTLADG